MCRCRIDPAFAGGSRRGTHWALPSTLGELVLSVMVTDVPSADVVTSLAKWLVPCAWFACALQQKPPMEKLLELSCDSCW